MESFYLGCEEDVFDKGLLVEWRDLRELLLALLERGLEVLGLVGELSELEFHPFVFRSEPRVLVLLALEPHLKLSVLLPEII